MSGAVLDESSHAPTLRRLSPAPLPDACQARHFWSPSKALTCACGSFAFLPGDRNLGSEPTRLSGVLHANRARASAALVHATFRLSVRGQADEMGCHEHFHKQPTPRSGHTDTAQRKHAGESGRGTREGPGCGKGNRVGRNVRAGACRAWRHSRTHSCILKIGVRQTAVGHGACWLRSRPLSLAPSQRGHALRHRRLIVCILASVLLLAVNGWLVHPIQVCT